MTRTTPLLAVGALMIVAGALLAAGGESSSPGWLVLIGAVFIAVGLVHTLLRATSLARRRQHVKHDHSWWTNLFGDTSTPDDREGTG